jgi:integrase
VRVLTAAGITERTTLHDLRRTWATVANAAGVPSIVLAAMLGHTPAPGMEVSSIYGRVTASTLRQWADKTADNMMKLAATKPTEGVVLEFPGAPARTA